MSMCITLNTLLRSSFISYKYSTYLARVVILDDKRNWLKLRNESKRLGQEFEGLHYLNKFVNTEDARRLVRLNSFNMIKNSGLQFRSMKNVYKKRGSVKMFGLNIEQVIKASEAGNTVIREKEREDSFATSTESSVLSIEEDTLAKKIETNNKPQLIHSKTPHGRLYSNQSNFQTLAEEAQNGGKSHSNLTPKLVYSKTSNARVYTEEPSLKRIIHQVRKGAKVNFEFPPKSNTPGLPPNFNENTENFNSLKISKDEEEKKRKKQVREKLANQNLVSKNR